MLSREAGGLLAWENVRRTLYRIRSFKMPSCHNINELDNLLNNNKFVYETYGVIRGKPYFNGSIDGQFIFSNGDMIADLDEHFELFIDGTHGIVPYKQEQLLVILATLCKKPRPIIYVLMTDRKESTYTRIFQYIKDAIFPANKCFYKPAAITADFEMALRNGVKNVWQEIEIFGCYFHFCQALHRRASSYDYLLERIENSEKHKEFLMMIMRLGLLPIEMIDDGIAALKKFKEDDVDLQRDFLAFMHYFDKTWIGRYPVNEWCISGRQIRTNNFVEGHNFKIKQFIPTNPTPWSFLDGLKDLYYDADASYINAKAKNISYKDKSRFTAPLKELIPKLKNGIIDELEFLSQIAFV
ncbi:uncharacterized protein [Chironomus tepperi]|uniref:uncharacterized protein n=1 Tax=Chironomus tepperi TaxID=113505 RepID=UPI00391FB7A0